MGTRPQGPPAQVLRLCLRTTTEEAQHGRYITFHGTVNVRAMLDHFDLLLKPSYNEGQPGRLRR